VDAALAKLDQAAATDLGPPQYFRGLALAGLPPDRRRAERAVADLEFVLAVRDQFPPMLLRAAHHGLAAAHAALGQDDQAAEAERKSGLGAAPADTQLMFGGFWATAQDGFRFTSPRILRPDPVSRSPRATTSATSRSSRPATASSRSTPEPPRTGSRPRSATLTCLLIQGHTTLTELFTAGAVAGLEAALTQLHGEVLDGIRDGRTLPDILEEASLPAVLRDHPTAVVPYLVIRDHFTERLYHQRTGYWQPDGHGLEPATAAEHAAALDLLAGGREEQFAAAASTLIGQGDYALALEIIQPGLLRHPASITLAGLRRTALHRLMEQ
jgi:hypothetical protein